MDDQIKDLVSTLKASLEDFTGGSLTVEEARDRYRGLLDRYTGILGGVLTGDNASVLKGICYHHNCENYSLFSGLYTADAEQITPVAFFGDLNIHSRILGMRHHISSVSAAGSVASLKPGTVKGLPHQVYIYTVQDSGLSLTIFITVSSSPFFSENKFAQAALFIKEIVESIREGTRPLLVDYHTGVKHEIENFIFRSLDDGRAPECHFFVFNMLERIFIHMGLNALSEISDIILNTLHDRCGSGSTAFALSLSEYIVLIRPASGQPAATGKKRIEVVYRGISIPYQTLHLQVESREHLQEFWQGIFSFAHYVRAGDVQK
jgi:hypothetical protein